MRWLPLLLLLGCVTEKVYVDRNTKAIVSKPTSDAELFSEPTIAKWDHINGKGTIFVMLPLGATKPTSEQKRATARIIVFTCSSGNFEVSSEGIETAGPRLFYYWRVYCTP